LTHRLLYDADCGFCRWSLGWILRWDRGRALEPLALQDPQADGLLAGMDPEHRMASWHLVAPDGTVTSAGGATAPLLRLLPGGGPLAALLGAAPTLTERAYAWISANRGALGRRLPERSHARADAVIAERRRRIE
jgi:predicted DCC family thiol-disulfide oxidoreductase YuxK